VATGDLRRPTRRQRRRIDAAVRAAEAHTGLQLCVVLGRAAEGDPRAQAEALFVEAGLVERPAVLVLVDPPRRHVEVVTSPEAKARISDDDAAAAVAGMTVRFAQGDLVGGLTEGVGVLAQVAGEGVAPPDARDLPNVLDDEG
jgi:uncharacterized membrane protein YgcG